MLKLSSSSNVDSPTLSGGRLERTEEDKEIRLYPEGGSEEVHDFSSPSLTFERGQEIQEEVKQDVGKIVEFPAARLTVGEVSPHSYEKKHGQKESKTGRLIKHNFVDPSKKAAKGVGDFGVKALGESYLDRLDILTGAWSDKNNNYTRGVLPKIIRMPLSLLGIPTMGNTPSLLMGKTGVGKKIIDYRRARRARIDRFKTWVGRPFQKKTTEVSRSLPLYKERYGITQKIRGIKEWVQDKKQKIQTFISGGISGVFSRKKQNKAIAEKQKRRLKSHNTSKTRQAA